MSETEIEQLRRRVRNQTAALHLLASECAFVRVGTLQGSPFFAPHGTTDEGPILGMRSHWYMPEAPLPDEQLTPGVRRLVNTLRTLGWRTTDSGDGVANVVAGMEGALNFPHVVVTIHRNQDMRAAAYRMRRHIEAIANAPDAVIEATYNPIDDVATLFVGNVSDAHMRDDFDVDELWKRDPDREVFCCAYAELNEKAEPVISLNCGDTFAYACADAEDVDADDLYELAQLRYEKGWTAVVEWIAKRRKERGDPDCVPIPPVREEISAARRRDEQITDQRLTIDALRAQLASARTAVLDEIGRHVVSNMENAASLAAWGGDAAIEARCRALATGYIEDVAECLRMDDQQALIDDLERRVQRIAAKADEVTGGAGA